LGALSYQSNQFGNGAKALVGIGRSNGKQRQIVLALAATLDKKYYWVEPCCWLYFIQRRKRASVFFLVPSKPFATGLFVLLLQGIWYIVHHRL
jgi:hypothetical protein